MDGDLDALRDYVKEHMFEKEPLAFAIMLYLSKHDKMADLQIMDLFDARVDTMINMAITEALNKTDGT